MERNNLIKNKKILLIICFLFLFVVEINSIVIPEVLFLDKEIKYIKIKNNKTSEYICRYKKINENYIKVFYESNSTNYLIREIKFNLDSIENITYNYLNKQTKIGHIFNYLYDKNGRNIIKFNRYGFNSSKLASF